ncbi:serine/threonine phosphatase [Vallitalea longa]|uniref:Serine/threonine phosphatase n=1 Tax=Vallitalea longa TaxID=2936439 RepID=A0A9W5YCF5_9FIRM|nr:DNA repair exonuclease [Vallitalea longa]GKX30554.1 serine/threonine phosphatase [Vallitalea longa]
MISLIHTGDIHIGMEFKKASFGSEFARDRRNEIKETFYRIIDRAVDMNADFLLISGDLFEDEYATIGEIKEINKYFRKLNDTRIVIIAGNHDPIINNKSYYKIIDWAENVYILDTTLQKISFEDVNVDIYGLSWNKKLIKDNLFENIQIDDKNRINILLAHGDIYQKSSYLPIDRESIANKGFDYIALGHIHKHEFICKNIAYPGSPEPLDFGETGTHGIIEGSISKDELDIKFLPFSKREFVSIDVSVDDNMTVENIIENIKEIVREYDFKNLYRFNLNGIRDKDILFDTQYIKYRVEEYVIYAEILDNTTPDYDLDKLKQENENNVIGKYIEYMEEQNTEDEISKLALYEGIEALLSEKVN